jgi:hypothetical protein
MHAVFFALALSAPTAPAVALAMQPSVGLSDDEITTFTQKLTDEIASDGCTVVTTESLDAACIQDPGCVESTRAGLLTPPAGLLAVELVRVGPVLQLTATGSAGAERGISASHGLDEKQLAGGRLLPDQVHAWLRDVVASAAPVPVAPPPKVEEPPADTGFELTPLKSGGLFAGGVGAVALVAGIITIGAQEAVLSDAASKGEQKETAHVVEWVGVGAAVLGVAGVAGGVALFMLE